MEKNKYVIVVYEINGKRNFSAKRNEQKVNKYGYKKPDVGVDALLEKLRGDGAKILATKEVEVYASELDVVGREVILEVGVRNIQEGQIINYIDGGVHTGVILKNYGDRSLILFITSNPEWNRRSRKLTVEELGFLGYGKRERDSYFAPVVRSNEYVRLTGMEFPDYRISELKLEFR